MVPHDHISSKSHHQRNMVLKNYIVINTRTWFFVTICRHPGNIAVQNRVSAPHCWSIPYIWTTRTAPALVIFHLHTGGHRTLLYARCKCIAHRTTHTVRARSTGCTHAIGCTGLLNLLIHSLIVGQNHFSVSKK